MQNEKMQLQQEITELKDKIKNIENDIKDIKNKYPLIHLGVIISNCEDKLYQLYCDLNSRLTIYEGRLSSLENDQRG